MSTSVLGRKAPVGFNNPPGRNDDLELLTLLCLVNPDDMAIVAARWDHATTIFEGVAYTTYKRGAGPIAISEEKFQELCGPQAQKQMDQGLEYSWLENSIDRNPKDKPHNDPNRIATAFRLHHLTVDLFDGFKRFDSDWYVFDGYWKKIKNEQFESMLVSFTQRYLECHCIAFVKEEVKRLSTAISTSQINNIKLALRSQLQVTGDTPRWLLTNRLDGIAFRGSMVVDGEITEASADYFDTSALPYSFNYTDDEPTELLDMFRTSGVQGDEVQALQEFSGLCLTREMKYQIVLMFLGLSRSGKGLFRAVLQLITGAGNYTSKELNKFGNQFALGDLVDKLLCLFPDERIDSQNVRVALSRLLKIAGQDPVELEKKGKDSVTTDLHCKIAIFSNEMPELNDESGAMLNRLLIVKTRVSHKGKEDVDLGPRILAQHDELVSWALRGLWRLQKQGFTKPDNGIAEKYEEINSPIQTFVKCHCQLEGSVKKDTLYGAYVASVEQPMSKVHFFRGLRNNFELGETKRRIGGTRAKYIEGINLTIGEINELQTNP